MPDAPLPPSDETVDAPPPPEPPTASALTHSVVGEPVTATVPRASAERPAFEPPGFEIVRELGSGGMGVVYEARQARLNRSVALKALRGTAGDPRDTVRFLAEAEAVAAVSHPHVVRVFEIGHTDSGPFMVLELLTGGTLSDQLRAGKMHPRAAAELVAKLAGAVQAAHDLGIVHRDLKPGNVLFDATGEPKVTDFGLAKRAGGADLTRTQALMGTPAYMAPEQARGEARFVGPAADVWALGAILYECLCGARPFDADDTWALLRQVTDSTPVAPRSRAADVPRDLERVALKCLEKAPADRYPSAAALAEDLARFLAGRPVSVRPAGPLERFGKWVRRNPAVAGATAAVALALVAGTAVSVAFALQSQRRGADLSRANDELNGTNADLRTARDDLARRAADLRAANEASAAQSYFSEVALAHQLWKANDLTGLRAALARCPAERRAWEWRHLNRLATPEKAAHRTDAVPLAVAYSPSGDLLAHVTSTGTLAVIETRTGRERFAVPGTANRASQRPGLAFHPKGTELAYLCRERVRTVDSANGKWRELPGGAQDSESLIALAYAPDGRLLTASYRAGEKALSREVVIRDTTTGKTVSAFTAYTDSAELVSEIGHAAFSPDCSRLALTIVDSGIRIQAKGAPTAGTAAEPTATVWEVETGKQVGRCSVAGAGVFGSVAFAPDGRTIGAGGRRALVEFEPGAAGGPRAVAAHAGEVLAVAFDRTGLVWTGGDDRFVLAHDRATGAERFALRGCPEGVMRLAVSPDGTELAAGVGTVTGRGGAVYRFDLTRTTGEQWRAAHPRDRLSTVCALAPDASRFAVSEVTPFSDRSDGGRVQVRAADGTAQAATESLALRGALAPDGRLFLCERAPRNPNDPEREGRIAVLHPDGRIAVAAVLPADTSGDPSAVHCTYSPAARALVVVAMPQAQRTERGSTTARLQRMADGAKEPTTFAPTDLASVFPAGSRRMLLLTGVAVNETGTRAAASFAAHWLAAETGTVGSRGVLCVWDLATGKEVLRKLTDVPLHAVAFDARGRVAAGGGSAAGGAVFAWDAATGAEAYALRGHTRAVLALAPGPNGRLATGSGDRTVKVWDPDAQREVLTFDGFAREVTQLAFAPDGSALVAATGLDLHAALTSPAPPTELPPAEVRTFRIAK